MQTTQKNQLLVKITETGEWIDVRPFINFIQNGNFAGTSDAIVNAADEMDTRIRFIATNLVPIDKGQTVDFGNITDLYSTLYQLRDMLQNTSILNKKED